LEGPYLDEKFHSGQFFDRLNDTKWVICFGFSNPQMAETSKQTVAEKKHSPLGLEIEKFLDRRQGRLLGYAASREISSEIYAEKYALQA
jgi:hypothetical protein